MFRDERLKRGSGAWDGVRIVDLSTFVLGDVGVVRIVCSDGVQGWGQMGRKDVRLTEEMLHLRVAPAVMNRDMYEPWLLYDQVVCFELNYKCLGVQMNKAIAGVDSAMYDAWGKRLRASCCELFGGPKQARFPVYASSISRSIHATHLADTLYKLKVDFGVRAFKIKVGKRMQGLAGKTAAEKTLDEWPGRSEQVLKAVRDRVGLDCFLAVDANGAFPPMRESDHAVHMWKLLRKFNVAFLEEPFFWVDYKSCHQLQERDTSIVLAGGEQEFRMDLWDSELPFQVLQPDISYCGGVSNALRIAEQAKRLGKRYAPHSPQGDMHVIFALHIMSAVSSPTSGVDFLEFACVNDGLMQVSLEQKQGEPGKGLWSSSIFSPPLELSDGRLSLVENNNNQFHGWGVEIRREWLQQARERKFDPAVSQRRSTL